MGGVDQSSSVPGLRTLRKPGAVLCCAWGAGGPGFGNQYTRPAMHEPWLASCMHVCEHDQPSGITWPVSDGSHGIYASGTSTTYHTCVRKYACV